MHEQVQEVLTTLSLAFENLLESSISAPSTHSPLNFSRSQSPVSFPASPSKQLKRVKKFQRPGRRVLQSKTPSPSTSPVHTNETSRKRSWDDESANPPESVEEHHGKRTKSVVLLQELEGLRLSSPPSPIDADLETLAEAEFSNNANLNFMYNLKNFRDVESIVAELESIKVLDDVFLALLSLQPGSCQANRTHFTHWCKWRLLVRFTESIPNSPFKVCLSRLLMLGRVLNHISSEVDWRDAELSYLIFQLISKVLQFESQQQNNHYKPAHLIRKLDEFMGLTRGLNVICVLFWNRTPRTVFEFLAHRAGAELNEFFELSLEAALNLFELCSLLNGNVQLAATFALVLIHFGRLFVPSNDLHRAFLDRIHSCKIN